MLPRRIQSDEFFLVSSLRRGLMDKLLVNLIQNPLAIESTEIRQVLSDRFAKLNSEHVSHFRFRLPIPVSLSSPLL